MKIPNAAFIELDLAIDLDDWLTDSDKQDILEKYKNQSLVNIYIQRSIRDYLKTCLSEDVKINDDIINLYFRV